MTPRGRGATSAEIDQATDDLDRDLTALTTSSELKDIRVELVGWSRAVRQAASDGLAAGALALDMVQFDRAMSARRTLCDYARLSRYVGAMSGDTSPFFRHFAQSCDVMAGLVLVTMGEGLAANGVTRGTAIVRVAAGDLQSRRNAVINALRNLTGSAEASLGQEDWPRGMEAYRNLVQQLEASGQTDLRTLLDESALAPALDQLVDLATGSTSSGLRELSTASTMLVQRLQQLLVYGQVQIVPPGGNIALGSPESPPLTAFLSALQLFIDAFTTTSSDRLLYLARPAIVTYGLYGMAGPDVATQRLINLAMMRGQIAEQIDCFANCGCDAATVRSEVLLDLLLYRLDRAIDSYAVGSDPDGLGSPEIRAGATAMLIDTLLTHTEFLGAALPPPPALPPSGVIGAALRGQLQGLSLSLQAAFTGAPSARVNAIAVQELGVQYRAEQQIERLVRALSPICRIDGVFVNGVSIGRAAIQAVFPLVDLSFPTSVQMPSPIASSFASFAQGRPDFVIAPQP